MNCLHCFGQVFPVQSVTQLLPNLFHVLQMVFTGRRSGNTATGIAVTVALGHRANTSAACWSLETMKRSNNFDDLRPLRNFHLVVLPRLRIIVCVLCKTLILRAGSFVCCKGVKPFSITIHNKDRFFVGSRILTDQFI